MICDSPRRALRALAVVAILAALSPLARAQQTETKTQLTLRPLVIFNQHLYAGSFSSPRGIFADRGHGEILVCDTGNNLVGFFNSDGIPLFAFPAGAHVREILRAVVDPAGRILILGSDRSAIHLFSYRGQYLSDLKLQGVPEKANIGALAFDKDDNLYVGENSAGEVLVYDKDLKLQRRFGSRGNEEGQFQSIAGIAVDDDTVYVIDHQVLAVQEFDMHGDFVRGWGKHDMGRENFSLPEGIAVDSKGRVVVVDMLRHEVKLFDKEGHFVDRFGGMGGAAGQVLFPSDVAVDASGRIWVSERGNSRVSVFEEIETSATVVQRAP